MAILAIYSRAQGAKDRSGSSIYVRMGRHNARAGSALNFGLKHPGSVCYRAKVLCSSARKLTLTVPLSPTSIDGIGKLLKKFEEILGERV